MVVDTLVVVDEGLNPLGVKVVELIDPLPGGQCDAVLHVLMGWSRSAHGPSGIVGDQHQMPSGCCLRTHRVTQLLD